MAHVYSQDFRGALIAAVSQGHSARSAGRLFQVSPSTAVKWVQTWRASGQVPQARARGFYRWRLDAHHDWLLDVVRAAPDLTLSEIRQRLHSERGVKTSINSLWRFFQRYQVVFKKNRSR